MKVFKLILLLVVTIAPIHAMLAPKKASPVVALLNGKMSVEGYLEQLKESPKSYYYWLRVLELKTAEYGIGSNLYSYLVHDISEHITFIRKYARLYRSLINQDIRWDELAIEDQYELKLYLKYVEIYKNPVGMLHGLIKESIIEYASQLQAFTRRGIAGRAGTS